MEEYRYDDSMKPGCFGRVFPNSLLPFVDALKQHPYDNFYANGYADVLEETNQPALTALAHLTRYQCSRYDAPLPGDCIPSRPVITIRHKGESTRVPSVSSIGGLNHHKFVMLQMDFGRAWLPLHDHGVTMWRGLLTVQVSRNDYSGKVADLVSGGFHRMVGAVHLAHAHRDIRVTDFMKYVTDLCPSVLIFALDGYQHVRPYLRAIGTAVRKGLLPKNLKQIHFNQSNRVIPVATFEDNLVRTAMGAFDRMSVTPMSVGGYAENKPLSDYILNQFGDGVEKYIIDSVQ